MRNILLNALLIFAANSAFASNTQVREWVEDTLTSHKQAQTYSEWENSGKTPEDLWDRVSQDTQTMLKYCDVLRTLSAEKLALFYSSLAEHKNELACAHELLLRVDFYMLSHTTNMTFRTLRELPAGRPSPYSITPESGTLGPARVVELDTQGGPRMVSGEMEAGEILLTFDDGPHPSLTPQLLNILAAENVSATFFMVGKNVKAYPDVVKQVANAGHIVGNHSYSHKNLPKLSREAAMQEIRSGFDELIKVLGFSAPYLRFPYGASTSYLREQLKLNHIAEYFWAIDTLDWKKNNPTVLLDYAIQQTRKAGRGIILFHDIQPQTIVMMPHFLAALKAMNFKVVTYQPKSWLEQLEVAHKNY